MKNIQASVICIKKQLNTKTIIPYTRHHFFLSSEQKKTNKPTFSPSHDFPYVNNYKIQLHLPDQSDSNRPPPIQIILAKYDVQRLKKHTLRDIQKPAFSDLFKSM